MKFKCCLVWAYSLTGYTCSDAHAVNGCTFCSELNHFLLILLMQYTLVLSMSSFPTLLFTTLYRLSLNVAATRLIIGQE